jgi:hypothetical protein
VAADLIVLIAASDLLPALTDRTGAVNDEVLTFSDRDALRALETIVTRRPRAIALEQQFAATPRGTALINRLKADPALLGSELRIVAHDSDYVRVLPRPATPTPVPSSSGVSAVSVPSAATAAAAVPAAVVVPALDRRGTRRAPRFRIAPGMGVLLDGNAARLVDLSEVGAQVISTTVLKPNQRARMVLTDDHGSIRCSATVAWASFEIPPGHGPQYRAGINFVDADGNAVGAFCIRHKQS